MAVDGLRSATGAVPPVVDEQALREQVERLDYDVHWRHGSDAEGAAEAERTAADRGWTGVMMRARVVRADAGLRSGSVLAAVPPVKQALAWAQTHGDGLLAARAHGALGYAFRAIGGHAEALTHAVRALSWTPPDAAAWFKAARFLQLGLALNLSGSHDRSDSEFEQALRFAAENGDPAVTLSVLNNLAYGKFECGDTAAAVAVAERMHRLAEQHGLPLYAEVRDTLARVEMLQDRHDRAEELLRVVVDDPLGSLCVEPEALPYTLMTLAEIQRSRGGLSEAHASLDRCSREADRLGLPQWQARVLEQRALLHGDAGDYREAFDAYRRFHEAWSAAQDTDREIRARVVHALYEVQQSERARDEFRELASRDALTGLLNRRFVEDALPALAAAARQEAPLAVALLDLDHFKRVNDTYSHEAGDCVLRGAAELITAHAPPGATVVRLGGEEFLLVMPGVPQDEALALCERVRAAFAGQAWDPVALRVTVIKA